MGHVHVWSEKIIRRRLNTAYMQHDKLNNICEAEFHNDMNHNYKGGCVGKPNPKLSI